MILPPTDRDDLLRIFTVRAEPTVQRVTLAGTFNGWNRDAIPLTRDRDGRTWRVTVPLRPGKHLYKFVLDGARWIVDPAAPSEKDGEGNVNSVLKLIPPGYEKRARPGDETVCAYGVRHEFRWPFVNVDQNVLTLSVRTRRDDVRGANLIVGKKSRPMTWTRRDEWFDYYSAEVPWNPTTPTRYRIDLVADRFRPIGSFVLNPANYRPPVVPEWAQGRVFYQIFPERFYNGFPANDPVGVVPWGTEPQYYNWMGGDLAGIRTKADYLQQLGVGGIYMTPIFEGPSNHGYETSDYRAVAKHFGTNDDLKALVADLDSRGIKTVLDGVFNHTSRDFFAFKDIVEKGARSDFLRWYTIEGFPVKTTRPPNYAAWNGYESMPKLNVLNPATKEYLLSLPGFWKEATGIAGWRLDVANEVEPQFWREFRKTVKAQGADQWIVGENWTDGTAWLQGDQWDSQMGYEFRAVILRFFTTPQANGQQLVGQLSDLYRKYPPQVARNLMNLLSSHDVPRFLTEVGGDARKAELAAVVQLTYPGSPSIYYGEEIGMTGGADPQNRRGMEWERATDTNALLATYRRLIALRMGSEVLRRGDFRAVFGSPDGTFGYTRTRGRETVLVVGNGSDQSRTVPMPPGAWVPLAGSKGAKLGPFGWGAFRLAIRSGG